MKLERGYFRLKDLRFGKELSLKKGVLTVEKETLERLLLSEDENDNIESLNLEIVRPGENTRIVHILDTVPVGLKIEGEGAFMPGQLAEPVIAGSGKTHLFENLAVMECAELPWAGKSALLYPRDSIVDMTGPAAGYSPFSETFNLILRMEMVPGAGDVEYDDAVRNAGIRCARRLAELLRDLTPDWVELFDFDREVDPDLPRIAYVTQCQNQGVYANTFLYGHEVWNTVPTYLNPTELMDGCIVSGNYVWPCFKVPSWIQANLPAVMELSRGHGTKWDFTGVVFDQGHNDSHFLKKRTAGLAANLVRRLGAQGVLISWEGGNAATDAMLTLQICENWGIKAVPWTFEFGGPDGREGILLVDDVPEARWVVSTGSIEKPTTIPAVQRVAGGTASGSGRRPEGSRSRRISSEPWM